LEVLMMCVGDYRFKRPTYKKVIEKKKAHEFILIFLI
jgi:hypothetical protein